MHRARYALLAAAGLTLAGGGTAQAATHTLDTVAGNNGTVKAQVTEGECAVTVDWYGMDASAATLVEFRLHGASGDAVLAVDSLVLDADGAHGGDLDGSRTFDLNDAIVANGDPDAGAWQVKVTTHTTYSQGADTKYKVVWVTGCEAGGTEEPPQSS